MASLLQVGFKQITTDMDSHSSNIWICCIINFHQSNFFPIQNWAGRTESKLPPTCYLWKTILSLPAEKYKLYWNWVFTPFNFWFGLDQRGGGLISASTVQTWILWGSAGPEDDWWSQHSLGRRQEPSETIQYVDLDGILPRRQTRIRTLRFDNVGII